MVLLSVTLKGRVFTATGLTWAFFITRRVKIVHFAPSLIQVRSISDGSKTAE